MIAVRSAQAWKGADVSRHHDSPERMELPAINHDPLPANKQRLIIPCYLSNPAPSQHNSLNSGERDGAIQYPAAALAPASTA